MMRKFAHLLVATEQASVQAVSIGGPDRLLLSAVEVATDEVDPKAGSSLVQHSCAAVTAAAAVQHVEHALHSNAEQSTIKSESNTGHMA